MKQPYAIVWESEERKELGLSWKQIHPISQRPSMKHRWVPVTNLYTETTDFAKDAKDWGDALNDAGWKFDEVYQKVMGTPTPGRLFNTAKSILRECIIEYSDKLKP